MLSKLKRKDGYVSVEAIFVMTIMLLFSYLIVSFFLLLISYGQVGQDVRALSVLAERQGGLTADDISSFQSDMTLYPFVGSGNEVNVSLQVSGYPDALISGDDYIPREHLEPMVLTVTTPSNDTMMGPIADVLGLKETVSSYEYRYVFYSERY